MRSRDRWLMRLCGLAAGVAVLGVGGGLRWVVALVGAICVVTAASQIRSRRELVGISPLVVVLAVLFVLTALQLVPLPDAVFDALHSSSHELVHDGEALLGTEKSWRALSLDPPATWFELAKLGAYLMIGWMALRLAARDRGRKRLLVMVAGLAAGVALVAVMHELLGIEQLYGIYKPVHANPVIMGPLLNSNHLACLMVLGALVAAGLAIDEQRAPPIRIMWVLASAICIAVALATRSRGGVLALAGGATVMAVLVVLQRLKSSSDAKRRDVLRVVLPAASIVLCTLVLVIFMGGEVRTELEATRLEELSDPRSKYAAWRSSLELVDDSPVLGIGKGAFQSAFTRVHPASSQLTFSHVENVYLQAVLDYGIAGALIIFAALGFAFAVAVRRWSTGPLVAAAIGALAAIGLQSVVDFGLELPGIAIPAILVAATLLHVPLREASPSSRRIAARAAPIAVVAFVTAVAGSPLARTLDEDHRAFATSPPTYEDARAAFARHPLDYLSAAHIARSAPSAELRGAFINHALRLHPRHTGLHRAIAGWLRSTGRVEQAALEYRIALSGSRQPESMLMEIVLAFPDPARAASALPLDHPHWNRIVNWLVDAKREPVALAYLAKLVETGAERRIEVWRKLLALAEKQRDLAMTELAARGLVAIEPSIAATLALARIQLARGHLDDVTRTIAGLVREPVTSGDHVEARSLQCDVLVLRKDFTAARTCYAALFEIPTLSLQQRQRTHGKLAVVEDALGNKARADLERRLSGEK